MRQTKWLPVMFALSILAILILSFGCKNDSGGGDDSAAPPSNGSSPAAPLVESITLTGKPEAGFTTDTSVDIHVSGDHLATLKHKLTDAGEWTESSSSVPIHIIQPGVINLSVVGCNRDGICQKDEEATRISFMIGAPDGTESHPNVIRNRADLYAVGTGDGDYFTQLNSIDLSADASGDFTPIATGGYFNGVFDGNNYRISGVTINTPSTRRVGFFKRIGANGTVKNVHLENVHVTGKSFVGGLMGESEGTVTHCSVSGTIIGKGIDTVNGTGMLVGVNRGTITDSITSGSVVGRQVVGGITGMNRGGVLTNVENRADVSADSFFVGGIVGNNGDVDVSNPDSCQDTSSDIINSRNKGVVVSGSLWVGGVAGANCGLIKNSRNSGSVRSSGTVKRYIAGITGMHIKGVLENNANSGNITGGRDTGGLVGALHSGIMIGGINEGDVSGITFTGGLVGHYNATGTISNLENSGAVDGSDDTGGIVGYLTTPSSISLDTVSNRGTVTGKGKTGGIIGTIESGNTNGARNLYLSHFTNYGDINGVSDTGGLLGMIKMTLDQSGDATSDIVKTRINTVSNRGNVLGTSRNTGGILGGNYIIITSGTHFNRAGQYNTIDMNDCDNTGVISGGSAGIQVGGLIGRQQAAKQYDKRLSEQVGDPPFTVEFYKTFRPLEFTVRRCHNTSTISGYQIIGGLVGYLERGIVTKSYNTGSVSGNESVGGLVGSSGTLSNGCGGHISRSYNRGSVSGTKYVGGLTGVTWMGGSILYTVVAGVGRRNNYAIMNSYNVGRVTGREVVGGISGYFAGDYGDHVFFCPWPHECTLHFTVATDDSFWDTDTTGLPVSPDDAYGKKQWSVDLDGGRTTSIMFQKNAFHNWDFTTIWAIDEGNGYPYLR